MRRLAALVSVALLAAACGNKSGVVGTWTPDFDATFDGMMAKLPPEAKKDFDAHPERRKQATESMGKSEIELRADGTAHGSTSGGAAPGSGDGTWTEKDGVVTITPSEGKGGHALELRLRDGRLVGDAGGMEIILRRK
jgi:hypothetical protein